MGQIISRRALLKGGVAAGSALALAAGIRLPSAGPGFRTLSEHEGLVVAAVAGTMFPRGAMPVGGLDVDIVGRVDEIVTELATIHGAGFRYLLRGLEWGSVTSHGRPFTKLATTEREEVLTLWGEPDIVPRRVASDALKMVLAMAFFSFPEVLDAIGYRAACGGGVS